MATKKTTKRIKALDQNYTPSVIEEEILDYWKKNKIFEKSVDFRPKDNPYTFYDGPPFITGLPHYGHLLGSIVKDLIPRFWTMKGKRVERVWGWDCHGLPAENKVEQELGINSKKEIEELGIDKFVAACKAYVNNVSEQWEWYVDHIGRWVDFKHAYRTMDLNYMESVMWVFKQLYDQGHIYKGKRVSLFCPRCSTPISNFEVAMDNTYKDVTDPSVFIKFKLVDMDAYFLAWTTTPWTLPANAALGVDPAKTYVEVEAEGQHLILAKSRLKAVFASSSNKIIKTFKGSDLVGKKYQPLYTYLKPGPNDYQVYAADFVSPDEGTGIVHIAPGFGEDDTDLGKQNQLSMFETVTDEGKLIPAIKVAADLFFKKADKPIIADLTDRGLMFKAETITHSYPHCHRCGTPLLYKAQEAWYIKISDLKDQMLESNESINWFPQHFKHGRFAQGIESAPDWCISRSRYWGSPIPVWECDSCQHRQVFGSLKELSDASGQAITDLHRPDIDQVVVKCPDCGGQAHRVKEVLDSWVESASMPYAQLHYPFEHQDQFKAGFPADFITEYTGQLRAWFYVMHVISNALYQSQSFNNVIVTGVIMGNDGRKMSKNYGNYPDPKGSIEQFGADALRLYLMGSPIVAGQDIAISEDSWREELKTTLMILWNSYKFFVNYAAIDNWQPQVEFDGTPTALDLWILNRLDQTIINLDKHLTAYNIPKAVEQIRPFVSDLSTWYIRRSRDRVGPSAIDLEDKQIAYTTMYTVFTVFFKAIAPITPFISEYLYRHLTDDESVHLCDWPEVKTTKVLDKQLLSLMQQVRKITEAGHNQRKTAQIPVRQPLASITVYSAGTELQKDQQLLALIMEELNIEAIDFKPGKELKVELNTTITPDLQAKGQARDLIRQIQQARKEAGCRLDQKVNLELPDWPKDYESDIKSRALVNKITKGPELKIIN